MQTSTLHCNCKWLFVVLLLAGLLPAAQAQNLLFQNFDGNTFPPAGQVAGTTWTIAGGNFLGNTSSYYGDSIWERVPGNYTSSTFFNSNGTLWTYPYEPCSHLTGSGSVNTQSGGAAFYGCYYNGVGSFGDLATPPLNFGAFNPSGAFKVTFWLNEYYINTSPPNSVEVYVNTSPFVSGATLIGSVTPQNVATTNANTSGKPNPQYGFWVQNSFIVPASFNTNPSSYIIFRARTNAANAGDIQLDDVSVDYVPACNNTPLAPSIITGPLSAAICSGTSVTLTATDAAFSPGISYVWQDSIRGGTWTTVGIIGNTTGLTFSTPALFDTTYVRLVDSCQQSHAKTASNNTYKVPVTKVTIPYLETFNTTANATLPPCYAFNDNYSTNWQVQSGWHAADGTAMSPLLVANDPLTNAQNGKSDFFTLPGLTLNGGANIVYAIRFKYARGKDNPYANTGTAYPEHLQVYANSSAPGYQVSRVTSGTLLFDRTINFDNVADTTIYFAPPANGGYYLTWYTNTPHPSGGGSGPVTGGTLGVDSIYVNVGTCVTTSFIVQPQNVGVCIGKPATLSAVVAGTGNAYQWKKNGVNIAGANQASYSVASTSVADANNYTLAISNPCGSIISNAATLTVNSLPIPIISPASPAIVCATDGAVANAIPAGSGPFVYIWRRNDTIVSGTGSSYTPIVSANYSYIVTDANGCTATSGESQFIINAVPAAIISPSGPTTFCNGDSVTLNANTAAGLTYQWLAGGIPISGATAYNYKAKNSIGYSVKVTLGSCSAISSIASVTATLPPVATITNTGSLNFCDGGGVILSTPLVAGYTYQWRLDGNNINGTAATYTATQQGVYDVVVTSAGVCSAPSTNTKTVVVNPAPIAFISNLRPLTFCAGDSTLLNAQPDLTNGYTYTWKLNGSNIIGASNSSGTYTAYEAGSYTVSIVNGNNCGAVTPGAAVTVNSLPLASVSGTTAICSGNSTTLTAPTGAGFSYQWKLGTANISGANGAAYTTSTAGTYSVALTDGNGCKANSASLVLTINPLPTATLTAAASTSFCPGGSVVLTAASDIGSPAWYKDGVLIPSAAGNTYTASTPGSYTVNETSTPGCLQSSAPVTVINFAVPTANINTGGPTTFCPGGSVVLSTLSVAGYSYQWKNSSGNITTGGTSASYTALTADSYRVTVTSDNGCVNTSTTVAIATIAAPVATIAASGPTTFCSGNSVVLNTNTGSGLTYTWKRNNINVANGNTPYYTATASGSYTVAIDNIACSVLSSGVAVSVNSLPVVNANASGPTTFCSNGNVTLTTNAASGYQYQWVNGGAIINGASGSSYIASSTGTYSVVVINANGCTASSANIPVTVNQAPVATLATPGSTNLCAGDTSLLMVNAGAGSYQYRWYVNTSPIPGAIYRTYNAVATGIYTAQVTGSNGCSATAAPLSLVFASSPSPVITAINDTLSVATSYATYQWYLDGVAIPGANRYYYIAGKNGAYTVNVTSGTCSGISPALHYSNVGVANATSIGGDITVYPNPASSVIHIIAPLKVNVVILGIDGKELMHVNDAREVNIDQLASGVYLYAIYANETNVTLKIGRLVKTGR